MGSDASCAFGSWTGSSPGFLRQVQLPPGPEENLEKAIPPRPSTPPPAAWGFVYSCG